MRLLRLPSRAVIDREVIRRGGLAEFVKRAWHLVDNAKLVWDWHLDVLCRYLEKVTRREIRDLIINIPPGCSKSLIVSVLWPAWQWTLDPGHRFIAASYAEHIVLRDARRMRSLVETAWYQEAWPHVRLPDDASASTAVGDFRTTAKGMRFSVTVRQSVTGEHTDTMIVDDPIDPMGAARISGTELDEVIEWWDRTASTRFRDHANAAKVVVMQRIHERDLSGHFKKQGATVLCLPMRFEAAHPDRSPDDPRMVEGETISVRRFPEAIVAKLEKILGPAGVAAQFRQAPAPAGGLIFREDWFQYWVELPDQGTWSQSWDMAFKAVVGGSHVAAGVWLESGPNHYLVDEVFEYLDFNATVAAVKALTARYPQAVRKLVEDKANGTAVIATLSSEIPGFVEVEPDGGKIARANAVQPLVAGRNVFLPHPELARYPDGRRGAPWVAAFLHNVTRFPNANTDDQTDQMTQYLASVTDNFAEQFRAAMAAAREAA